MLGATLPCHVFFAAVTLRAVHCACLGLCCFDVADLESPSMPLHVTLMHCACTLVNKKSAGAGVCLAAHACEFHQAPRCVWSGRCCCASLCGMRSGGPRRCWSARRRSSTRSASSAPTSAPPHTSQHVCTASKRSRMLISCCVFTPCVEVCFRVQCFQCVHVF